MPFTHDHLNAAIHTIKAALDELRPQLMQSFGNVSHTKKADASLVTDLDMRAETLLRERLRTFDPTIGFEGEETGATGSRDTFWLVDPIDGTQHFIRGLPYCTNMIALIHHGEVILGVIYNFAEDALYSACQGGGAFRNDEPIQASQRELEGAMIASEIMLRPGKEAENQALMHQLECAKIYNLFNSGSVGYDMTLVADGRIEGRITKDAYGAPYDYAAGALIAAEAGAIVRTLGSSVYDYQQTDFYVLSPNVHEQLMQRNIIW